MRGRNSLVERVSDLARVDPARAAEAPGRPENYLEVRFEGGQSAFLDMSIDRSGVWADVLRAVQRRKQPAYVEIDPETGLINELLLPLPFTVGRIEPEEDGLAVELIISHGGHHLRRSNPDFEELGEKLEAAMRRKTRVLVTETDEHEIIDVQPMDEPAEALE